VPPSRSSLVSPQPQIGRDTPSDILWASQLLARARVLSQLQPTAQQQPRTAPPSGAPATPATPSAGAVRRGEAGRDGATRTETGRVAIPRPTPEGLLKQAPVTTNRTRSMAYGAAYGAAARVRSGRGY
jgi:hypothetical protein